MRPSLIKAKNIVYFMQDNLLTLKRQGPATPKTYGTVDNITATYSGNQIASLRDDAPSVLLESSLDMASGSWSGSDFAYDRNGNQTRDLSRGVADIQYNELNLPNSLGMRLTMPWNTMNIQKRPSKEAILKILHMKMQRKNGSLKGLKLRLLTN